MSTSFVTLVNQIAQAGRLTHSCIRIVFYFKQRGFVVPYAFSTIYFQAVFYSKVAALRNSFHTMAVAREIVSTGQKIQKLVDPAEKTPCLPSSLTDCVDGVKSRELVHSNPDKREDKACGPKGKTFPSILNLPEHVRERKFKSKSKLQKTDYSYLSYLQLAMDVNAQKGNHYAGRLNTNGRYHSSVLCSSGHTIKEPKINPGEIPSLLDIVIPMVHADSFQLYPCTSQLRLRRETFYSGLYTSDFSNQNSDLLNTDQRKLPSLLDIVLPTVPADSFMLNSCVRQLKPTQGTCFPVLCSRGHTNRPMEVPKSNQGKIPSLLDIVIPVEHDDSLTMNICTRKQKPKRENCRSLCNHRNEKMTASTSNPGKITSLLDIVIPVEHADSLKLNTRTRKQTPKRGNCRSSSNHRNKKMTASASNPGEIPSLLDIVIPAEHADSLKLNTCPRKQTPKRGNCQTNRRSEKMPASTSNPGKIPSLLDIVIPMKQNDSLKLNTCDRQYKATRGHSTTASRKSEKRNQKIAALKSNTRKMELLCHPETPSVHTQVKEFQPIQRNVNVSEMGDATHDAVGPLSQNLNNQDSTLCANTNQNIALCSATGQCGPVTRSGQDSNAIPATDRMIEDENDQKQHSVKSAVSSAMNGHLRNVNTTEAKPEKAPLQQSETPHGQAPRQRRLARFLGPIPFRSYMYIVDTNNHHDYAVNNDNSFQHGGDLPLTSNNDRPLPDRMRVSESEDGPLTPEPYKSRHESFVWKWPQFPVPRSQTADAAGEDDTGARMDPLPELEMTVSEFMEMINDTYREPIIEGIDAFVNVQQGVINRTPTNNHRMSQTTDQTVKPSCQTQPPLMDVTGQLGDVSRFRQ